MSLLDELLDASNDKPANIDHIDEAEAKSLPLNEKIDAYFAQINKNWMGKEGKPHYQGMTKQEFQNQYNSFYSGIQEAQQAVSLGFPQSFQNHIYLAHTLASVERYDDALQVLKSVTAQDENQKQAYEELSAIYCRVGMYEEAGLCGQRVYDLHQIEENKFKKSPDPMRRKMGVKLYPEQSFYFAVSSIQMDDFQQAKECCARGISDLGNFGIKETDHNNTGGRYEAIALSHFNFLEGYIHFQDGNYEKSVICFCKASYFSGKNQLLISIIEELSKEHNLDLSQISSIQEFKNTIEAKSFIGSQEIDYLFLAIDLAAMNLVQSDEELQEFYEVVRPHLRALIGLNLEAPENEDRWSKILRTISNEDIDNPLEILGRIKNDKIKNMTCVSLIEIVTHFMADAFDKGSMDVINKICCALGVDENLLVQIYHFYRDLYVKRLSQGGPNREYYQSDEYLDQDIYYLWGAVFLYLKFTDALSDSNLNLFGHYIARISQNTQINLDVAKQHFLHQSEGDIFDFLGTTEKIQLFYISYAMIIETVAIQGSEPTAEQLEILTNYKRLVEELTDMKINVEDDIQLMRAKHGL